MQVILMRHGEAEGFHVADDKRQLTNFGKIQAQHTASHLLDHYTPDLFVVSPFTRTKQTMQVFTEISSDVPVIDLPDITPDVNPSQGILALSEVVQQHATTVNCVLVVCHMPIVASMVSLLTTDRPSCYKLAEARIIDFEDIEHIAEYLGTQTDAFIPLQS